MYFYNFCSNQWPEKYQTMKGLWWNYIIFFPLLKLLFVQYVKCICQKKHSRFEIFSYLICMNTGMVWTSFLWLIFTLKLLCEYIHLWGNHIIARTAYIRMSYSKKPPVKKNVFQRKIYVIGRLHEDLVLIRWHFLLLMTKAITGMCITLCFINF